MCMIGWNEKCFGRDGFASSPDWLVGSFALTFNLSHCLAWSRLLLFAPIFCAATAIRWSNCSDSWQKWCFHDSMQRFRSEILGILEWEMMNFLVRISLQPLMFALLILEIAWTDNSVCLKSIPNWLIDFGLVILLRIQYSFYADATHFLKENFQEFTNFFVFLGFCLWTRANGIMFDTLGKPSGLCSFSSERTGLFIGSHHVLASGTGFLWSVCIHCSMWLAKGTSDRGPPQHHPNQARTCVRSVPGHVYSCSLFLGSQSAKLVHWTCSSGSRVHMRTESILTRLRHIHGWQMMAIAEQTSRPMINRLLLTWKCTTLIASNV